MWCGADGDAAMAAITEQLLLSILRCTKMKLRSESGGDLRWQRKGSRHVQGIGGKSNEASCRPAGLPALLTRQAGTH
ncbi:hypothetical protein SKAU_G00177080 [Synaphobranchus kaupii]|uniref:Uncharacterized protein n=1 Tax=Synaphobranchus kaupii TaxID=118154 RepID=A0A9Q1FLW2_SYNKA|nr:hypothetical protein SKAU_G00177080 [Synaphobranchus kaupii]